MKTLRRWSTRHANLLLGAYEVLETTLRRLGLSRFADDHRFASVLACIERPIKSLLFDCRMCGQCVLDETGMSCPMNCPKSVRNGPCGGVRANGDCEVQMIGRCVWVEAWRGCLRTGGQPRMQHLRQPLDHRRCGRSAWAEALRLKDKLS